MCLCVCVCVRARAHFTKKKKKKALNSDILFNMMKRPLYGGRIPVELEVKVCEEMKPGMPLVL